MTTDAGARIEATLAQFAAEYAAAWDEIVDRLRTGDLRKRVRTGFGGSLIIANAVYVDGKGTVTLTEDGLPAITDQWHTGDHDGDSLYFERWEGPSRRMFHGYIDPVTRRLVQTG